MAPFSTLMSCSVTPWLWWWWQYQGWRTGLGLSAVSPGCHCCRASTFSRSPAGATSEHRLKPHGTTSQACCFPNCEDTYNLQNGVCSLGGKKAYWSQQLPFIGPLSMPHQQWEEVGYGQLNVVQPVKAKWRGLSTAVVGCKAWGSTP